MDNLSQKVNESAKFYTSSLLNFDYQLADFSFQTLLPFFRGVLALELGPASGYMTKQLVNHFESLHLVEGSQNLLDQIPAYSNVVKHHTLFEDFETELRFDTIIMSHVLEHISDPVYILKKIYNWLKPGAVLLVSVPNAKSIHRLVAVQMDLLSSEYELNTRDLELGHYRVYDKSLLIEHVKEAGYQVLESGGYFLKPVSNGQIENNWNPEMINGFYKVGKYFQDNCAEIFVVCTK
jgi:2-polyprenyl-3-methyl-5-hydroxy-6-metoxy-1,4-benzoquinol methylase